MTSAISEKDVSVKEVGEKVKCVFLRDAKRNPNGCIVISADFNKNEIRYQLSVLNPKDKFDKHLARKIAMGRLEKSPIIISDCGRSLSTYKDIMYEVMSNIAFNSNAFYVCDRAKKLAKIWLGDVLYKSTSDTENAYGNSALVCSPCSHRKKAQRTVKQFLCSMFSK